ncbi:MAG: hypothetical protein OWS74_06230 [Firmicutes bacterium]|nr:hypothetical protein [Bacillota bacterium]
MKRRKFVWTRLLRVVLTMLLPLLVLRVVIIVLAGFSESIIVPVEFVAAFLVAFLTYHVVDSRVPWRRMGMDVVLSGVAGWVAWGVRMGISDGLAGPMHYGVIAWFVACLLTFWRM